MPLGRGKHGESTPSGAGRRGCERNLGWLRNPRAHRTGPSQPNTLPAGTMHESHGQHAAALAAASRLGDSPVQCLVPIEGPLARRLRGKSGSWSGDQESNLELLLGRVTRSSNHAGLLATCPKKAVFWDKKRVVKISQPFSGLLCLIPSFDQPR